MRRLIGWLLQLIVVILSVVALTAAWIVLDGLQDSGHQQADVALVFDHRVVPARIGFDVAGTPAEETEDRKMVLGRAAELYRGGNFPYIIVSGSPDIVVTMSNYLQRQGVPSSAILTDSRGTTTLDTARDTAATMRGRDFHSVVIVADYFQMTRTKLALKHEKVETVEQAHVGTLKKADAMLIGREIVALYDYIGTYYLLPEAKKVQQEAAVDADKAKVEAEKAKQAVDQKIDSLPK